MELVLNLNIFELFFFSMSIVFVFEGILYALFPKFMKNLAIFMIDSKEDNLRIYGLFFCALGMLIIYFI